ncbi:MAG: hypothetical protein ACXWAT_03860 [Methylobacter sp.]
MDANHQPWSSVIPIVRLKGIPDITPNLSVRYTDKDFVAILEFGDALSRAFQRSWPLNLYVEEFRVNQERKITAKISKAEAIFVACTT